MRTLILTSGLLLSIAIGWSARSHAQVAPPQLARSSSWLSMLPDGDLKRRFIINCTGCHVFDDRIAMPGGAPRTLESWREQIARMHKSYGPGTPFPIIADPIETDALAEWLSAHARTTPAPEPPQPDTRVTEFAFPAPQDLPHDVIVAPNGSVVITGMFTHQMYVLDPRAGTFATEPIPVPRANPRAHHIDRDGTWWVVLGGPGLVARRSPAGEWRTYNVGMYAHSIARDERGAWVNGHFTGHPSKLTHVDASSGAMTTVDLPSATRAGVSPIPYEIRTGPDQRIWMSELNGGRVLSYDPKTGQHRAYEMPMAHSAPRRLDVSRDGRVWIPLYAGGDLVELDPASGKMTRHALPDRDALPYVARVDDVRAVVWLAGGASDAIYRFDRKTGRFDTVRLPSRGTLVRHLDVDTKSGDLWVAYGASPGRIPAKIARVRWTSGEAR